MKQIAAEISANQSISQFPIFVKAKHLADIDDLGVEDFISDSPSYDAYTHNLKAFTDSNSFLKVQSFCGKNSKNLIEIYDKSSSMATLE